MLVGGNFIKPFSDCTCSLVFGCKGSLTGLLVAELKPSSLSKSSSSSPETTQDLYDRFVARSDSTELEGNSRTFQQTGLAFNAVMFQRESQWFLVRVSRVGDYI